MKWVGLTGGIASGKSTVAKILRDLGRPVIDADVLAHEVIRKDFQRHSSGPSGYDQVLSAFGPEVLGEDGEVDRKKLGAKVFADSAKLKVLEEIVHPLVQEAKQMKKAELEAQGAELAFYDVPLLFEKELQNQFDCSVLVFCTPEQQRSRLRERNGFSDEEIELRLAHQISMEDKRNLADFIIENTDSMSELKVQVQEILSRL